MYNTFAESLISYGNFLEDTDVENYDEPAKEQLEDDTDDAKLGVDNELGLEDDELGDPNEKLGDVEDLGESAWYNSGIWVLEDTEEDESEEGFDTSECGTKECNEGSDSMIDDMEDLEDEDDDDLDDGFFEYTMNLM